MKKIYSSIPGRRIIYVTTIIFLAGLSFYSFILLRNLIDSSDWMNHTSEIRISLEKISRNISEAETIQRGFFLCGDSSLLKKRDMAFTSLKAEIKKLGNLIADNPDQQENLKLLNFLITEKLESMQNAMDAYQPINTNDGFALHVVKAVEKMEGVKKQLDAMAGKEMSLLKVRQLKYSNLSFITPIIIIFLFLGALTILTISYFRIDKAFKYSTLLQIKLNREKILAESIMQGSLDSIQVVDKNLRIIDLNKRAMEYVSVSKQEIIGKNILELYPEMKHTGAYEDLKKAISGETIHNKMYHSPVTDKFYENFFIPLNIDNTIEAVLVVARDLTEFIAANKQLEKQNAELDQRNAFVETLINSTPDLIMVIDSAMRVVKINSGPRDTVTGRYTEEIIGKKIVDIDPDLIYSELFKNIQLAMKGETIITEKSASLNSDQFFKLRYIPLLNNGEVDAVMVISHNVTKEVKSEKFLKDSEEKFNTLFQLSPFSITLSEIPSGKYVDVNEHFIKTFKFTREDIIGKTSEQLGMIDDEARNKLLEIALRGESVKNAEIEVNKKTGEKIPVLVSIETITIGEQKYFLNAIIDIIEIRKAEEELHQTNIKLKQMNEELTTFTYISSHDLQEPLRKIQTFADRIKETEIANLSATGLEQFNRIQNAANRMQTLIDDLLTYSRTNTEERKFENINLQEIIEEVKDDLSEELIRKKGTIESNNQVVVKVIPFQFRQLILNLVGNSLKFSRQDVPPHITIKSKIGSAAGFGIKSLPPKKKYFHISFSDNGIGFEPGYSKKIFEVFQRLHGRDKYSGTGIGLAIVKKIVENHNGIITAKSELDQGATFDIYIPAD